ncbi:probable pectinesterase 29 [Quercus lobata]|uniref:probable pectinesterase 29 n=1 Tax=Quercus lobata TaxID=97700 RepID=UPI001246FB94|nr:probable pectinesterase 29 [Quercus lobata]
MGSQEFVGDLAIKMMVENGDMEVPARVFEGVKRSVPPKMNKKKKERKEKEKVTITYDKTCIFRNGAGRHVTLIEWGDHKLMNSSSTFTSVAENLVVKGIEFKNTYNIGLYSPKQKRHRPALAAEILGDKAAFYNCSFSGMQDTLWDAVGHHYFYQCYIQGGIDFIFGNGQSFYEGRDSADDPSGFVFKDCETLGKGKAYLGRAFSRVIIANSKLSDVVVPQGWNAWFNVGHE